LRPLAIQGELAYLIKVSGQQNDDDAIADWDISYELFYLTDNVHDFGLPTIINNLAPFAEFSYEQVVNGPQGGTQPNLVVLQGSPMSPRLTRSVSPRNLRSIRPRLPTVMPLCSAC
jgi:hypothetical protein